MNKRGLSTVITTLIIILLVLVAVGIVWVVIRNVLLEGSENISLKNFINNSKSKNVIMGEDISINIKKNVINHNILGIGWNNADSRYLTESESRIEDKIGKTLNEDEWEKYFDLLKWSGSEIIRHGFWVQIPSEEVGDTLYEPVNDNDNPFELNKTAFDFESPLFDLHYKHLKAYKDRDITVFFTHWKNNAPWNAISEVPYEIAKNAGYSDETWEEYKNTWDDILEQFLPLNHDEYAEGAVYLLKYLIEEKEFTNIKYFSMWNEPNFLSEIGYEYPAEWWPMIKTFHDQMEHQGIRDSIKFVAPDSSGDEEIIPFQLEEYGEYIDIIADHDYHTKSKIISEFPQMKNYEEVIKNINDYYGYEFPFIVAEYGECGKNVGEIKGDDEIYAASISQAKMIIKHFKQGVKGFLRWQYSITDSTLCYTALDASDDDYWFKPFAPVYYPHAVYARYVKKGMNVFEDNIQIKEGEENEYKNVEIVALGDNENEITILLVNEADFSHEIKIVFDELNPSKSFNKLYVDGPKSGIINGGKIEVIYDSDLPYIKFTLGKKSIMTLTTLDPGDLNEPEILSLKKS